ncbi:DNA cytosine methyltransferase [Halomonas sp. I5-271120]|uniref:DNA cytosine methyltransferase n=1 Tax=Halomonas sp. I5-271120 TaxID=3061632 RepID=UPI002714F577|nr:DNA cytosine methyltransferase [Halomonas sp. I5-271120]
MNAKTASLQASRAWKTQFSLDFAGELVVDLFAGGGGASTGLEMGLNRPVDIAINHDPDAISMHEINHPGATHYQSDVFEVDPLLATKGQPVGHFHASPDCTHHSQARGGQPRKKAIRSLSWVVHKWAGKVRPRVITLENVEAMLDWSPLQAKRCKTSGRVVKVDGMVARPGERVPLQEQFLVPDKRRKGHNWQHFVQGLRDMGYEVQWRTLRAKDYGAPTRRERLFLIARCDGQPITWPEPTHALPEARHGRKLPAKGQQLLHHRSAADCMDWSIPVRSVFTRKRPLAAATQRRIARGLSRFVLNCGEPFILPIANWSAGEVVHSIQEPLRTITAWPRGGSFSVVAPTMIQVGYGERKGQSPRCLDLHKPLGTVVAGGVKHALCMGFMAQMNGGYNETPGHHLKKPMSTICGRGTQQQLVTAQMARVAPCSALPHTSGQPAHRQRIDGPLQPTIQAMALQTADFLIRNGGADASPCASIEDKLKLVTIYHQEDTFLLVDIGLRMLEPRELYRAQGFPDSYVIDRGHDGRKLTKTAQTRMVGNSVSPLPMAAIVRANHSVSQVAEKVGAA